MPWHYNTLGIIIIAISIVSIILMYRVDKLVKKKAKEKTEDLFAVHEI